MACFICGSARSLSLPSERPLSLVPPRAHARVAWLVSYAFDRQRRLHGTRGGIHSGWYTCVSYGKWIPHV
jgi:hypothetical protein